MRWRAKFRTAAKWTCTGLAVLIIGLLVATRWYAVTWRWKTGMAFAKSGWINVSYGMTPALAWDCGLEWGHLASGFRGLNWWSFSGPTDTALLPVRDDDPKMNDSWGSEGPVPGRTYTAVGRAIELSIWPFALSFLLPASMLWWHEVREQRRRRQGLCPSCGYDRRGLAPQSPCPECAAKA